MTRWVMRNEKYEPPGRNLASCRPSLVHVSFLLLGLMGLALTGCGQRAAGSAQPGERIELRISSEGEFIAFTPTELACPAGAKVRLVFHHEGQRIPQKHNWVLILPGTNQDVEKAAASAGEDTGWVPKGDHRILAATPLCSPGGEAVIEFTAPAPGDYPYICSTPGHAAEMHGVLHVTKS
jgi:azurin